jgi:hypothetical protein
VLSLLNELSRERAEKPPLIDDAEPETPWLEKNRQS